MFHLKWRPPNSMESHGSRWFFYVFLFGDSRVPWNSVEYSWEVQGSRSSNDNLKVPWNSMELSDTSFGGTKVPCNSMECSMEFHGTKWYVIWRHQSSMEFHGIFHGIPWNICVIWNGALLILWKPMELGDFLFGDSRFPWNSMEYPLEVQPG